MAPSNNLSRHVLSETDFKTPNPSTYVVRVVQQILNTLRSCKVSVKPFDSQLAQSRTGDFHKELRRNVQMLPCLQQPTWNKPFPASAAPRRTCLEGKAYTPTWATEQSREQIFFCHTYSHPGLDRMSSSKGPYMIFFYEAYIPYFRMAVHMIMCIHAYILIIH